ncbi:MAG: hypothetical protein ACYCYP_08805 [Leptospirales bacterium]
MHSKAGTILLVAMALSALLLLPPAESRADSPVTCDSLYSLESGGHTVWDFFSHPCPPESTDSESALPGIGVTLLGIRTVPTLFNPFGTPVSQNDPLLNNQIENGFGGGIEINGWLAPNLALRFETSFLDFPAQAAGASFQAMPVTLGVEIRLVGSEKVFLYAAADGGIVINGPETANIFVGTGGSPYMQEGIGLNLYFLQFEADYATIFQPFGGSLHTNPLFFVPFSLGIHL